LAQAPATAVVVFNLGGPDRPESVEPFLFNLFNDPAIIDLPKPLRWLVATLASKRRARAASEAYAKIGGASPLLANTREQANALQAALQTDALGAGPVKVFIAMRYWRPMVLEAAYEVRAWEPDRIVLLPLYPQFSTTTTASSLTGWRDAAKAIGLKLPTATVCCYPRQAGWIKAAAELTIAGIAKAAKAGRPRVLFSAHGLPEKILKRGDPYQWQVEQTAAAVAAALPPDASGQAADWRVCYQSRVGPLKWIGPSTESEIEAAGHEGRPLVVVPIAFVSEHSETLVELDMDYAERAKKAGVPAYVRVPAVGTHPAFIAGLAELVRGAVAGKTGNGTGKRLCPDAWRACACTS
jgi:protoporphyrin/coproporphyrin ferrochelatase